MARLYGRLKKIVSNAPKLFPSQLYDMIRVDGSDGTPYTLIVQLSGANTLQVGTSIQVVVTTLGEGGAQSVQSVTASATAQRLRIAGDTITVTAQVVNDNAVDAPGSCDLNVLAVPGTSDALGDLWLTWVPSAANAAEATVTSGIGNFLSCQGALVAFGGSDAGPYWMNVYDNNTAPNPGDSPLFALGPLTIVNNVGTAFSFDKSVRPSIKFGTGLTWALSKSAFVHSAPASGASARCDMDYGT